MMENNYVLIKKVHIKTQSKKLYFTRNEGFQFIVFDKNCTQENANPCTQSAISCF